MSPAARSAKRISPANRAADTQFQMIPAGRFQVCDLVIESSVLLPELREAAEGAADCRFKVLPPGDEFAGEFRWFHRWPSQRCQDHNYPNCDSLKHDAAWLTFADLGEDYLLRFPDQADFLISRDGKEVQCCPAPGTPQSTVRHLFLDQIIPLILTRREPLVLHASANLTSRGVIAFVGKSGQGKSTLAACLGQAGYRLISDDYVVLRRVAVRKPVEDWIAVPSYPGVRLWPDASDGIFAAPPESAEIAHYTEKRRVNDPKLVPFADQPSSLRCLYILDDEDDEDTFPQEPSAVLLSPKAAFMKLVAATFNLDIRDKVLLEQQFEATADLSSRVPCFHLRYSRDFSAVPAVLQLILSREQGTAA